MLTAPSSVTLNLLRISSTYNKYCKSYKSPRSSVARSSRISSVNRLWTFTPPAISNKRMALAVRPCRPITLPKFSG